MNIIVICGSCYIYFVNSIVVAIAAAVAAAAGGSGSGGSIAISIFVPPRTFLMKRSSIKISF